MNAKNLYLQLVGIIIIMVFLSPNKILSQNSELKNPYLINSESQILLNTQDSLRVIITEDGKVGIGVLEPDYNVDICGTLRVEEVIIEPSGWCDFVFEPEYVMMDWREKEKFYLRHKHLPGIKSEKEILNNGLKTAETLQGMILNVEENRLDITELYKLIEQLQDENRELRKIIRELK